MTVLEQGQISESHTENIFRDQSRRPSIPEPLKVSLRELVSNGVDAISKRP